MYTIYNHSYTLATYTTKSAAIGRAISWKASLAGIGPSIMVVDNTTGEIVWGL